MCTYVKYQFFPICKDPTSDVPCFKYGGLTCHKFFFSNKPEKCKKGEYMRVNVRRCYADIEKISPRKNELVQRTMSTNSDIRTHSHGTIICARCKYTN